MSHAELCQLSSAEHIKDSYQVNLEDASTRTLILKLLGDRKGNEGDWKSVYGKGLGSFRNGMVGSKQWNILKLVKVKYTFEAQLFFSPGVSFLSTVCLRGGLNMFYVLMTFNNGPNQIPTRFRSEHI